MARGEVASSHEGRFAASSQKPPFGAAARMDVRASYN